MLMAARCSVETIMVTIMRPQTSARNIFRELGFHEEIVHEDHVRDRSGKSQDIIMMRCDLKALWKELKSLLGDSELGQDSQSSTCGDRT